MKKLTVLSILIFAVAITFANSGTESEAAKVTTPQKIEGKILDKVTNEALAGVAVQLAGSSEKYYTDFEGNFVINGVQPGVYDIDILYVSYEGITLENITTNDASVKLKVELESVSH